MRCQGRALDLRVRPVAASGGETTSGQAVAASITPVCQRIGRSAFKPGLALANRLSIQPPLRLPFASASLASTASRHRRHNAQGCAGHRVGAAVRIFRGN